MASARVSAEAILPSTIFFLRKKPTPSPMTMDTTAVSAKIMLMEMSISTPSSIF